LDGRGLTAALLVSLTLVAAARGSRGVVRTGRSAVERHPPPESPPHPVVNASWYEPDAALYKIRIDDRGDLCVYVVGGPGIPSADAAMEEGEAYAEKHGWEFSEEDVTPVRMSEAEEDGVRAWLDEEIRS